MANYYRNDLYIRGAEQALQRFQRDALPKDDEKGANSWGGHENGLLSFLSLVPPPAELRVLGTVAQLEEWRRHHWGCALPEVDDCIFEAEYLNYWFSTMDFCAHNFVISVSKLYPELAFTLLWNDVYSGEYGTPMSMALLAVQGGSIVADYVEMDWATVLAVEAKLPPEHKLTEKTRHSIRMRIEKEKNWDPELAMNISGEARAILRAAKAGDVANVRRLLDVATVVEPVNSNSKSPEFDFEAVLDVAIREGHEKVIQLLLERGIGDKNSALVEVASGGMLSIVSLLVEMGADPRHDNEAAMRRAVGNGHGEVAKHLAGLGCDVWKAIGNANGPAKLF